MTKYYVSKDGNNGNGLTLATAKTSIQAGINLINNPGDELAIYPGIYVEQVSISKNGTAANNIHIYGVGNKGDVVIDGRADVAGLNTGLPAGAFQPMVSNYGRKFKYTPLFYVHGDYTHVENITIKRSLGRGIQFGDDLNSLNLGGKVTDVHTIATRGTGINHYGTRYTSALRCTVKNATNFIEGADWAAGHAGAFVWRGSFDYEAIECDVYDSWGEGFMVDARDGESERGLLSKCRSWNCATAGIYVHATRDLEIVDCYVFETDEWNPNNIPSISANQGLHIRVMEQQTYDFGSRHYTENVYVHRTKTKNVPIGFGAPLSGTNTAKGLINVRIEDCEFVRTDGEGVTVNCRNTHQEGGCTFKNNRIITNSPQVVDNDSYFQEYERANNIWNRIPDTSANLGTGDTVDPSIVESPVWPPDGDPLPSDLPAPPSGLEASNIAFTSLTLIWVDNSTDEYKFEIYRKLKGESQDAYAYVGQVGSNVTIWDDLGLEPDTSYNYVVEAFNPIGGSGYSNEITVSTLKPDPVPEPPNAPSNLESPWHSGYKIDLTWTDNSTNETKFNIKRSIDNDTSFTQLTSVPANTTSFRDKNLEPATLYYYRIQAENEAGISPFSNVIAVFTDGGENEPGDIGSPVQIPLNEGDPYVYVLDKDFNTVGIIDDYNALIWTEAYQEAGKFELHISPEYVSDPMLEKENYLVLPITPTVMVIRDTKIIDGLNEDNLVVTGRSAEILLDKRFMEAEETFLGKADLLMKNLVYYNAANPTRDSRNLNCIVPPALISEFDVDYNDQMKYQTVYDALVKIAKASDLGFRMRLVNVEGGFISFAFEVYQGIDRTVEQTAVSPVIFAEDFGNVLSSSFYTTVGDEVTFVYVVSDDPAYPVIEIWYEGWIPGFEPEALERVEHVLEVSINRQVQGQPDLTDEEVYAILVTKAKEYLKEHRTRAIFEGEYDIFGQFVYEKDFFMGDFVSVSLYGQHTKVRIIETVRSYTNAGIKTSASFEYIYQ